MADGLFLMQRYWGSEDESSSESICKSVPINVNDPNEEAKPDQNKNDIEYFEPKKKKRKLKISDCFEIEECSNDLLNDDISDKLESSDVLESPKVLTSKKKKKPKKLKKINKDEAIAKETNLDTVSDNLDLLNKTENSEENFCVIGQVKGKNIDKIKPTLPKWLRNPTVIGIDLKGQEIPISDLSYLDDTSKNNLEKAGILYLFPVQLSVIPWLMQSNQKRLSIRPSDLCVSAPTGSGKTLAFVLPIVQSLKDRLVPAIRAVVVLPVSDLAFQVYKVFETFVRGTDLKVTLLTGQKSFTSEQNKLVKSGVRRILSLVDIIVTTPGRIIDHINKTDGFCLQHLRYLIIDEADRMMDSIQQGWLKHIEEAVYSDCHKSNCVCFALGGKRIPFIPSTACSLGYIDQPLQKLLYSATLSHDPEKLHALSLYKPKLFTAQAESEEWIGKCPIPDSLTAQAVICRDGTKPLVLCHLVKERQFKKMLCFTESVERARRLQFILEAMAFVEVREISSNHTPVQRKIMLEQFNSGKVNLLVCSDLVARGIDIESIDCVVLYDAPKFAKTYVHRIGRTARAGKKGTGLTLLTQGEASNFKKMLEAAEIAMPEKITIIDTDLEPYVDSFKNALEAADCKLKKLKTGNKKFKGRNKHQKRIAQEQTENI